MKPITEKFIWEVMDSIKYYAQVNDTSHCHWILPANEKIENYQGPDIHIDFNVAGGMINITVTNGNKASEQKFMMFEDEEKMDIDQTAENLEEMIRDLVDKENNPDVDYNEKMNFDDIYGNSQEPVEDEEVEEPTGDAIPCKAYLEDGEVLLVFDETNPTGQLDCWSVNGEHSSCDKYYLDELEELDTSDKRVADAVATYESQYGQGGAFKLDVLPKGEMLSNQESGHKEIYSRD